MNSGLTFDVSVRRTQSSAPVSIEAHRFILSDSGYLRESAESAKREYLRAVGCNDSYGFKVARKTPSAPWNVTAMELTSPDNILSRGRSKHLVDLPAGQVRALAVQFLDVEGAPLDSLLSSPTFQARRVVTDGPVTAVEFSSDVQSALGTDRVRGGTLRLLNAAGYILDGYDVALDTDGGKGRAVMAMEWVSASGDPVPAKHRVTNSSPPSPGSVVAEYTYSGWTYGPQQPDKFRLAHYGLPEPTLPDPPASYTKYYVAAGIVGALLITAGIVARRRNR